MKATEYEAMPGVERLRQMVNRLDCCRESAIYDYTVEQLLALDRAWALSEWDIPIDQWTDRQVREALAGRPPTWEHEGKPTYDKKARALAAAERAAQPEAALALSGALEPVTERDVERAAKDLSDAVENVAVSAREFLADPEFRGDLRRAVDEWTRLSGEFHALMRRQAQQGGSAGGEAVAEGGR